MNHRWVGVILFLALASVSQAWAKKGFFAPNLYFDSSVYEAVYKFQTNFYVNISWTNQDEFLQVTEKFQARPKVLSQLNQCKSNQQSFCMVSLGLHVNGSAIALRQQNHAQAVWTNFHLVQNFLSTQIAWWGLESIQQIQEKIKSTNIPIILRGPSGKVLFNSLDGDDRAYLEAYDSSLLDPKGKMAALSSDAVRIKLSRKLPYALVKGSSLKAGDKAFVIGYPKATSDRKEKWGVPDSDGLHQFITEGEKVSSASLVEKYGLNPLVGKLILRDGEVDALNADCEVGQSGGAIVNQNGEFVGLLKGIYSPKEHGPIACLGLTHSSLKFIEYLSKD